MTNEQWRGIATGSGSALTGIGSMLAMSGIGAPIGIPLALAGVGLGLGVGSQFIKDDMPIPMATNISNNIMTMPRMRDGGVVNNDSIFSYMMGFKPKATRGMTIPPYDQSGDIEFVNKQLIPDYANIQNQLYNPNYVPTDDWRMPRLPIDPIDLNLGTKDYLRLPVGYGGNRPILEIAGTPPYSDMTKVEGLPNLRKVTTRPEADGTANLDAIKSAITGKYSKFNLGVNLDLMPKIDESGNLVGYEDYNKKIKKENRNEYDKMAMSANRYNLLGAGIMAGGSISSLINEMSAQAPDRVRSMASKDVVLEKDQSDFINYMNRNIDSSRNLGYRTATSMGADPLLTSIMLHNSSLGAKMQTQVQANQTRQQIAMTQEQLNAQQRQSAQQRKLQADQFNAHMQFNANQLSGQNIASSLSSLGTAITSFGGAKMRNNIYAEMMKRGEFNSLF